MAAFGFSVGDFVTSLALINNVSQALKDSNGSASDFKALDQTLQSLSQAMTASEVVHLQWSELPASATFKANSKSMINGMLFERQKCRHVMETFLKAAQPYTDAFIHERGKTFVRSWRKVRWLYQKDEVLKLERNLRAHSEALRIFTDALFQYADSSSMVWFSTLLTTFQKSHGSSCREHGVKDGNCTIILYQRTVKSFHDCPGSADLSNIQHGVSLGILLISSRQCTTSGCEWKDSTPPHVVFKYTFGK